MRSLLKYLGNRENQLDDIIALLTRHRKKQGRPFEYCYDLFCGSLSILLPLLALDEEYANHYVANDINPALTFFWQAVQLQPDKLINYYQGLINKYEEVDEEAAKVFYLETREIFNNQLTAFVDGHIESVDSIQLGAMFTFLTNHTEYGLNFFSGDDPGKQLLVSEPEKIREISDIDKEFAIRVNEHHQLFSGKNITFQAKNFHTYIEAINKEDMVLLDPPYPDMQDASENKEQHIFIRPEPKKRLNQNLKVALKYFHHQHVPFLMFYGVLGMPNAHSLTWPEGHLLRRTGSKNSVFRRYIEHLYVSADIAKLFIDEDLQIEFKAKIQPLFHQIVETHAQTDPYKRGDHTALAWHEERYTYAALNKAANQFAHYLLSHGPLKDKLSQKEDCLIAIYLDRGPQFIMSWLGTLKSGGAYLPIDTEQNRLKIEAAYERIIQSEADYLVTHPGLIKKFRENNLILNNIEIIELPLEEKLELKILNKCPIENPEQYISPEQLAYVIYTSGSTGTPKGVEILHRSLVYAYESHQDLLKLGTEDKVAQFASVGFDASLMEIMMAFGSGAELHLIDSNTYQDARRLTEFLNKCKITTIIQTPKLLATLDPDFFLYLHNVLIVGDTFEKELSDRWLKAPGKKKRKVVNGYGISETTIVTTLELCDEKEDLTIGKPILGCEVFLRSLTEEEKEQNKSGSTIDQQTKWIQPSQKHKKKGVLYISGPSLARGYWKQPDLTNQRFKTIMLDSSRKKCFYNSGDVGFFNPRKKTIQLIGRIDRQVKILGQRVELDELENTLRYYKDLVADVRVLAYNKKNNNEKVIVVYIVPPEDKKNLIIHDPNNPCAESLKSLKDILHRLRKTSANFILPSVCNMRFVSSLAHNKNDKKNYNDKLIRNNFPNLPCITLPHVSWKKKASDLSAEEKKDFHWLYTLCCDSLNLAPTQFGIETDYFAAGGDSISVKWLFINLSQAMEENKFITQTTRIGLKQVNITDFIREPTVLALWKLIQTNAEQLNSDKLKFDKELSDLSVQTPQHFIGQKFGIVKTPENYITAIKVPINLYAIHSLSGNAELDYRGTQIAQLPFVVNMLNTSEVLSSLSDHLDERNFLDELASYHADVILKHAKCGPYYLLGWSSGGLIALLIANKMRKRGERVFVINIDGHHPQVLQHMDALQYVAGLPILARKIQKIIFTVLEEKDKQSDEFEYINTTFNLENSQLDKVEYLRHMLLQLREHTTLSIRHAKKVSDELWRKMENVLNTIEKILLAELTYPLTSLPSICADDFFIMAEFSELKSITPLGFTLSDTQIVKISETDHFTLLNDSQLLTILKQYFCGKFYPVHLNYQAGLAAFINKQYSLALKHYNQAINDNPNETSCYYMRATVKLNMIDLTSSTPNMELLQSSLSDCETLVLLGDNKPSTYQLMFTIKMQLHQYQAALQYAEMALLSASRTPSSISSADDLSLAYAALADVKSILGKHEEAVAACNASIAINPNQRISYSIRYSSNYKLGCYQETIADCDFLIKHTPKTAPFYAIRMGVLCIDRAKAKAKLEQNIETIKDSDEALKCEPLNNKSDLNYMVNVMKSVASDNYEEGLHYCDKPIEINPNLFSAHIQRFMINIKLAQYDKAITDLTRALEINHERFLIYTSDYNVVELNSLLTGLIKLMKNLPTIKTYHLVGKFLRAIEQFEEAVDSFKKMQQLSPQGEKFIPGLQEIAFTYQVAGQYDLAINYWQQLLNIMPKHPMAIKQLEKIKFHSTPMCKKMNRCLLLYFRYLVYSIQGVWHLPKSIF